MEPRKELLLHRICIVILFVLTAVAILWAVARKPPKYVRATALYAERLVLIDDSGRVRLSAETIPGTGDPVVRWIDTNGAERISILVFEGEPMVRVTDTNRVVRNLLKAGQP